MGLDAYKTDADNRFSAMLVFDNVTLGSFFSGNPKNAMATSFGAGTVTTPTSASPPPRSPGQRNAH
jgi:hypothetical protein